MSYIDIDPGQLTEKITILRQTDETNATGQLLDDWNDLATRRAKIVTKSGTEKNDGAGEFGLLGYEIKIRYDASLQDVSNSDRIRNDFNGKIFDILAVINKDAANKVLVFVCEERKRDG